PLRLELESLLALERWLHRYGGHLVPVHNGHQPFEDPRVAATLCNFVPAWVGAYGGLNVIHDLAIFAGEYIISKNDNARWGMWYGEDEDWSRLTGVFGPPCVFGLRH